ncbi:MAG: hypothetical protein EP330_08890 [Deltaproteobacteria bacterium]|nr:MAG: hypothetical protein EP330_08890 [Deltaproteobacteria bacterium]
MKPRDVFIVVWIVVQMALPFSYYLRSERAERYDERWSWRMFSDVRMVRCTAEFSVDGRDVNLSQEFHMAWDSLLKRARPQVVDAVTERLCTANPGKPVTMRLHCREPDGSRNVLDAGQDDRCGGLDGP